MSSPEAFTPTHARLARINVAADEVQEDDIVVAIQNEPTTQVYVRRIHHIRDVVQNRVYHSFRYEGFHRYRGTPISASVEQDARISVLRWVTE